MGAAKKLETSPTWLTTKEVADRLGRCSRTVRRWLEQDLFPNAWRVPGGRWHIPEADLSDLLSRMRRNKSGS